MSTLVLKPINVADPYANGAIKVSQAAYNPPAAQRKTGVIEVKITSITLAYVGTPLLTGKGAVTLDIRSPNYIEDCDTPVMNQVTINQDVTTYTFNNDDGTYYIAVTAGMPGPSIHRDNDGAWNLLNILAAQHVESILQATITINYTLTYFDSTPTPLATPG